MPETRNIWNLYNKNGRWIILLLSLLTLFVGNAGTPLWDQDEAAYAGFARNMSQSGDWLEQSFIWSDPHRKPPWHMWSIAVSYKLFGANEFATRIPAALAILMALTFLWLIGKKIADEKTGLRAVMILSVSFLVPVLGKVAVTDAWLLCWELLSIYALLGLIQSHQWRWVWIFWAALAMGMLTKGPPILVLGGLMAIILLIFHPDGKRIWRLHPWIFLPLALLPLLAWGYLHWQTDDGKTMRWMIDWYVLSRTGKTVFGQTGPPGYYLGILMLAFLPFVSLLPNTLLYFVRQFVAQKITSLFLLAWMVAGWFWWEIIPSKLPAYALAGHPAVALLMALYLRENDHKVRWAYNLGWGIQLFFALIIGLGLSVGAFYILGDFNPIPAIIIGWIPFVAGLYLFIKKPGQDLAFHIRYYAGALFLIAAWAFLMPQVSALRDSPIEIQKYLAEQVKADSKIVLANSRGKPPSLPFYLGETFDQLINEQNPDQLLTWYQSTEAFAFILTEDQLNHLQSELGSLESKKFASFASDRIKSPAYYIVWNPTAKKE